MVRVVTTQKENLEREVKPPVLDGPLFPLSGTYVVTVEYLQNSTNKKNELSGKFLFSSFVIVLTNARTFCNNRNSLFGSRGGMRSDGTAGVGNSGTAAGGNNLGLVNNNGNNNLSGGQLRDGAGSTQSGAYVLRDNILEYCGL